MTPCDVALNSTTSYTRLVRSAAVRQDHVDIGTGVASLHAWLDHALLSLRQPQAATHGGVSEALMSHSRQTKL